MTKWLPLLFSVALFILPTKVWADAACHPISAEKIEQWWAYYNAQPGAHSNGGSNLYECIIVDSTMQSVCRTKPASPAHPSISIRTVEQRDGAVYMRDEGDTAGDCAAFLDMMKQFRALDDSVREQLRQKTGH